MLTTPEQRAEAGRLVDLDERGLLIEAVALAIRLGETQERAMADLVELDRSFIRELENAERGEGGLPVEGEDQGARV